MLSRVPFLDTRRHPLAHPSATSPSISNTLGGAVDVAWACRWMGGNYPSASKGSHGQYSPENLPSASNLTHITCRFSFDTPVVSILGPEPADARAAVRLSLNSCRRAQVGRTTAFFDVVSCLMCWLSNPSFHRGRLDEKRR